MDVHSGRGLAWGIAVEATLEINPCTVADVLPLLATLTGPKTDTTGGLATVQDVFSRSQIFKIDHNGNTVGAYAVEPLQFDRGICLWVQGLAGELDAIDLTRTMDKVVTAQALQIGARQVATLTKRRGLIRKLTACGWTVAGVKLVKKI